MNTSFFCVEYFVFRSPIKNSKFEIGKIEFHLLHILFVVWCLIPLTRTDGVRERIATKKFEEWSGSDVRTVTSSGLK